MAQIKELYQGSNKVWPEEWRKPWANTVAYRPLNSTTTVNDMSGNGYNLTQTGGIFGVYNDVDCFYTGYLSLTSAPLIPIGDADRTISLWVCPDNYSSSYERPIFGYGNATGTQVLRIYEGTNGKYSAALSYITGMAWPDITTWKRALLTLVVNDVGYPGFFVDGVLVASGTTQASTAEISSSYPLRLMRRNNSTSASYQVRWCLSEVIIENVAWSVDEVAAYYNSTKSNYWIA